MARKASFVLTALLVVLAMVGCTIVQAEPDEQPTPSVQTELVGQQPAGVPAAQGGAERGITVIGIGRVSLVPDIARISVGVEVRGSSVSEAKFEVDDRMEAITAALLALEVAERDIQTSQYSIYYEPDPARPAAVPGGTTEEQSGAYRVSSIVEVTVRDIDNASAVLDEAIDAGANLVYGVNYTVSDNQRWQSQAREEAIADANARAEEYAQLLGMDLGEALTVSEVIGGQVPFVLERGAAGGGGGIAPGELEMSMQVQVTYAAR
jgi:uncharacterized protein YggE